jgi:hypothetical protein
MSALDVAQGMTFEMDPRQSMRGYVDPAVWTVCEVRGWEVLIAPTDRCCIPARVTRASMERAFDAGELRPCSVLSA